MVCNKAKLRGFNARQNAHAERRERHWRSWGVQFDGKSFLYKDFLEVLKAQGGCCAICGIAVGEKGYADHDHETKQFRGVLCRECNQLLGFFEKAMSYLDRIQRYLKMEKHHVA